MRRFRVPDVKPTAIDRLVNYFDPVRGMERYRARVALALAGGYTGARRDRRSMQEWRTTSGSADADLLPDLDKLRDRTRDLSRNAPIASGAVNTVVTNVVGTGLVLQSQIDRAYLGLPDAAADEWQRAAEREWWLWASSQECDATRTQDFCGLQDLAFRSVLESGDVFVLRRYIERPGSVYGLKLQLVEADRVTNPNFGREQDKLDNGNQIAGGVELDADGAPVAYHMLRSHPGDVLAGPGERKWDRVLAYGAESGERMVLHLFHRRRPGQSRGVPYLAPVIESLKQLDRYGEAELMAAVVASMFTVFVKTEAGEGLNPQTPTAETGGTVNDEDYKLAPGAILEGLPGEEVQTIDPKRPNANFEPFVHSVAKQIGSALEVPFELILKVFNSSYSASRAALLEAWKYFRARREFLAWGFCQPVYEWVITEAVGAGRLSAPGYFEDPLVRLAYLGSTWNGPPAGQIDPESEASAAETWINLGVKTLSEVTAEITGGDWETKHAQRVKERRMRLEGGLEAEEVGQRTEVTAPEPSRPAGAPAGGGDDDSGSD